MKDFPSQLAATVIGGVIAGVLILIVEYWIIRPCRQRIEMKLKAAGTPIPIGTSDTKRNSYRVLILVMGGVTGWLITVLVAYLSSTYYYRDLVNLFAHSFGSANLVFPLAAFFTVLISAALALMEYRQLRDARQASHLGHYALVFIRAVSGPVAISIVILVVLVGIASPATGMVLFADDFDRGDSQWTTYGNERWETIPDPKAPDNTIYCVKSQEQHNYAIKDIAEWRDYALEFDLQVRQYGTGGYGGLITFHATYTPDSKFYEYLFADYRAALTRYAPDPQDNAAPLTHYDLGLTKTTAVRGEWHKMRIEARASGIKVFQDKSLVMAVSDPFPLAQGGIRLGATPGSEVCFDNVKVTALRD